MRVITISSKYQIALPSMVRARLGIGRGDRLVVAQVTNNEVVLKKEPRYQDLVGVLRAQKQDAVQRVRTQRDNWK